MRILLVGNYPLDKQTSMKRYADMLCEQLILHGHRVEIIQPRPILGGWVRLPALRKWLGYLDKYIFFPAALRRRARGFDLVHVCDHSNSMYLAHAGNRARSITCHDLLAIEAALGRYPEQRVSLLGRIQQRWIWRDLQAADNVVCVSQNTANQLADLSHHSHRRVVMIPNFLNPGCSPATGEKVLRLRERIGIASDQPYLFHIGAEAWYKNRLGLLRIFRHLLQELKIKGGPVLHLVVAGHPFSQEMRDFTDRELPSGSVVEVVSPSDDDLWSFYSGATALLFPSLHEGFGWPAIEAQHCGCPVIVSNRPPMTEVAGSAALYIDPADEPGAARSIAANLDRLADLREAGFRNAKRFDAATVFEAYDEFFRSVIQEHTAQT